MLHSPCQNTLIDEKGERNRLSHFIAKNERKRNKTETEYAAETRKMLKKWIILIVFLLNLAYRIFQHVH